MKKSTSPTMKDVAREAGVSPGTVSRALNGIPVREDSRLRIEEAVRKLDYKVNTYARGLKIQHTYQITVIVPDCLNPFFSSFVHYVEAALYERGYYMILCCSGEIPEKEERYINIASQNQSEGIILLSYADINRISFPNIPLVSFDRFFYNNFAPHVAADNLQGGILATKKLIEFGCKQPAFVRCRSRYPSEADKRMEGYLQVCLEEGLTPMICDKIDDMDFPASLRDFILKHTQANGHLDFDGIFANTDEQAFQMKQQLESLGFSVPEDVQLIGFDGIHKFNSSLQAPYVSTICQPLSALAKKCVDLVLAEDRTSLPSLTLLPVFYAYGGTTLDPEYYKKPIV